MGQHERTPSRLGRRLKEERGKKHLTVRELAEKAGVSPAYPSKIETGEIEDPGTEMAVRLAGALGMTLDQLLGEPEPSADAIATIGHDIGPGTDADDPGDTKGAA